ncbi:MAG: transaldolase family protein, partial [Acidimicrobiales bacterium]
MKPPKKPRSGPPTKPLDELHQLGQSIWYDNIRRSLLTNGELARYLEDYAVTGVTSNPTIFERAMASGADYDDAIRSELAAGRADDVEALFFSLAVQDIASTADVLRPVHDRTGGVDGYVSLEVSPDLADNTDGTVESARRLFDAVDRPNVMIKVPATPAGLRSVEALVADGIPVNVTLIFTVDQYRAVAEAYLAGLEQRREQGLAPRVASVAWGGG